MRRTSAALMFVLLFGVVALSLSPEKRTEITQPSRVAPVVGAHYYPWYERGRWAGQPTADTPTLGRYDSHNRTVVAEHIRWAKRADLDFFMLSCLNPSGPEAKNIRESVLPELDAADFRFALHYETPIALGIHPQKPIDLAAKLPDGTAAGDRLIEQFDYLAETYFHRRNYLRIDGKAVVMMYLVRNFENAGRYLKAMRKRLAARGVELYLIADAMYWEYPGELDWAFLKEHFQAVTSYNMYTQPDFLNRVEAQYAAADRAARKRDMRMIPHVMPGYDDTKLRGADRVKYDRNEGAFYRDYWKFASRFVTRDQPLLLITSFNEWHEGTEIEPSAEYGDQYLRLTRELVTGLRNAPR